MCSARRTMSDLATLRRDIEIINDELLDLLSKRGELVRQVQELKSRDGIPTHIPEREEAMLAHLVERNPGPFDDDGVRTLFKEIFSLSVSLMRKQKERVLEVSRASRAEDLVIEVKERRVGKEPILIAGPCAVEDAEQMDIVGRRLVELGVGFIRGGAFKPRTSPHSFQGLGVEGLKLLEETANRYGLVSVTEVMDTRTIELVASYADILQVGARNMYNYELLKELGRCGKPIFLKRALSATVQELLLAAEYIVSNGNPNVILCERGIRTFEKETRNTLDISAIPLLRGKSHLPVVVDVSHAAGRKDILAPLAKAAIAAGANGLMVEAHPNPSAAKSDGQQQFDMEELETFMRTVGLPIGSENTTRREKVLNVTRVDATPLPTVAEPMVSQRSSSWTSPIRATR